MKKWHEKIVTITGGTSGIGEAISLNLLTHGMTVINLDRDINEESVKEINQKFSKHPGKLYARKVDISDACAVKKTFEWIEEKFSFVNVHINSAGVAHNVSLLDEDSTEKINNTIDINFKGTVCCAREAIRLIRKAEDFGMIINIGSIFGNVIPFPVDGNIYSATKFAVRAFSEIMRQELIVDEENKIRISCISPGMIKTNVRVSGGWKNTEEFYENRPYLLPKEIAAGVNYLLSTPYNVNVTELAIRAVGERF
jgi:NADP-dependent 3-hydroxy acid dehydrogenase YdfG